MRSYRYGAPSAMRPRCVCRRPASDIDAAVDDAIDALGLTDYGDVRVGSLSGGQRKRASIACEILTRPGVCFLDEPSSGLDPSAAAALIARLRRLCDEGRTVIFTTHSVQDVEHCDRVAVLATGGRLVFSGTPDDLLVHFGAATLTAVYERLGALDHTPR